MGSAGAKGPFANCRVAFLGFLLGTWLLITYYGSRLEEYSFTATSSWPRHNHPYRRPQPAPYFFDDDEGGEESLNQANVTSETVTVTSSVFNESSAKSILFFNSYFDMADYGFGLGHQPFLDHKCPVHNCIVTTDRDYHASKRVSDFDAIIFHIRNMNPNNIQIPKQMFRKPHQRYIMFLKESPLNDNFPYERLPNFFNWTMTYRRDSDIPYPYGAIESKENPYPYPPRTDEAISWKPFDSQAFSQSLKSRSKDFFNLAKKPKKVAWIVSNCNTHSQREDFVRELRKHIQVDIFGGCGPTKCDKGHSYKSDNCSKVVDEEYKFYLSFENSFCNGYVTEKFFRRISHSVVPIVLGSGNYSVLAPPHSYINVMDFASPADLAKYLLHLDQHDEEYLSYFWWRDIYDARWGFRFENKAFCRLCAMLNNPEEPVKSYKSLQDWWVKDGHCIKKGSFPWSQPEQPFIMTSIQEFADRLFGTSSVI